MDLKGQELLVHYEQQRTVGKKAPEIARDLGIHPKTLERWLTAARKERDIKRAALFEVDFGDAGQPWNLHGDALYLGDVHTPSANYQFAKRAAQVARKLGLKRLVIAGDFWNFDAWGRYPPVVQPPAWKQEREAARAIISELRETFDEICIFSGNHDWRRIIANNAVEDAEDLVDLLKSTGVRWSMYKYCTVDTPNGPWRITHPRNYSISPLVLADQLALKYDCHIMSFHEHHFGISKDRYGRHLIVNGGCIVDSKKLAYVMLDDSKAGAMVNGFVVLQDGYPTLFGDDGWTDWRKWST